MVNFVLTRWSTQGSFEFCLSAMETQLETVDNGKTIRYVDLLPRGLEFVGILVYDT